MAEEPASGDSETEERDDERLGPKVPLAMRHRLKKARLDAKLSRSELAGKLGITVTQLGRIETGERGTRLHRAQRWLELCGISVDYIEVGEPERAALLSTAIASLDEVHLEAVTAIILAWPGLSAKDRRTILSVIGPTEP